MLVNLLLEHLILTTAKTIFTAVTTVLDQPEICYNLLSATEESKFFHSAYF